MDSAAFDHWFGPSRRDSNGCLTEKQWQKFATSYKHVLQSDLSTTTTSKQVSRSLGWKLYLNVITATETPVEQWTDSLQALRDQLSKSFEELRVDPVRMGDEHMDLAVNNPLSTSAEVCREGNSFGDQKLKNFAEPLDQILQRQ